MKKNLTFITFCLLLAFALSRIAGSLYYNPRPFTVSGVEPLIPHVPDNGFPSDHTLLFATLAAIAWYYDKRFSVLLWILALGVGAFRIYAGVHHPIDIAGSIAIALIAVWAAYAIIHKLWNKNPSLENTRDKQTNS